MISFKDYEGADGKIDWKSYRKAEVAAGERCYECGGIIIFGHGYRTKCAECRSLEEDRGEVCNSHSARCPKCRHVMNVSNCDLYRLYEEGDHEITCQSCEHDFEVITVVQHMFRSPALIDESSESEPEPHV